MAPSLKPARQALAENKIEDALEQVLDYEDFAGANFNSLLLKGTCYSRLQKYEPAATALKEAAALQPESPYPYKGLITVFKATKNWRGILDNFVQLVKAYEATDDLAKACSELVSVKQIINSLGVPEAKVELLKLNLTDSPVYGFMHGRLTPEEIVLAKLAALAKTDLDKKLSKITAHARTSISMTHEKVLSERRAAYKQSELAQWYRRILAVSDDDTTRRKTEADLIRLLLDEAKASEPAQKQQYVAEIRELVGGAVLFQPVEPLPYVIYWEWADLAQYSDLDLEIVHRFIEHFPDDGLALSLAAFLNSALSPFPAEEDGAAQWTHQEIAAQFAEATKRAKGSVLAMRLYADSSLMNGEWEQAVQLANEARRLLAQMEKETGISLPNTERHLALILGTANVYYQAPRHFAAAQALFDQVLATGSDDDLHVKATVGQALVQIEQGRLEEAQKSLEAVVAAHPDMISAVNALASCELERENFERARELLNAGLAQLQGNSPYELGVRAQMKWRIGYAYWQEGNAQQAFDMFVATLQESPSYAPAFTYLGLVYDGQGDWTRAQKCFYMALEIDGGEAIAAEKLATKFADAGEWDLVEIVAARLLESERGDIPAWPYRALGIVALAASNYSGAVKYFQHCLRLAPDDANSWVGLGEAYTHSGRYVSANKALNKALDLDPSSFSALYMLSLAQGETLQFSEAVQSLKKAMSLAPASSALVGALVNNHIKASNYFLATYRLGDAVDHAKDALAAAADALQIDPTSATMWNGVALACSVVLSAQGHSDRIEPRMLAQIALALDAPAPDSVESLMVLALEQAAEVAGPTRGGKAAACYNLATAYHRTSRRSAAIEQLKRALTLEPHNASFWNLYGVVIAEVNPRVAQHCFVRSLSLNGRSASAWANLGLLYLSQSDLSLASEAFDRALTVDAEAETAWLGQAVLEFIQGARGPSHVAGLFEHAYLVSPGQSQVSKLLFGLATFKEASASEAKPGGNGIGALEQLLRLNPSLEQALLLMGLLLERSGDFEEAIARLTKLPPSPAVHSHLARLYLAMHSFEDAKQQAQLSLEGDAANENVHLCAMLVQGLAHYFLHEFDDALDLFTAALEFSDEAPDVVVLLAQVLWAHGGADERQVAIDNIYDSIGSKGSSLRMVLLLGVIGILGGDSDVVDAIRDEINGLSASELATDRDFSVPLVLSRLEASTEPFHRALFRNPAAFSLWKRVDSRQALRVAASTPKISTQQLSDAYAAVLTRENAQRAVFYSPASATAWQALAKVSGPA